MMHGLRGLLSQAERVARKRAQTLSSAHVLLALYRRPQLGELLETHGIAERALLEAIEHSHEEHANLLGFALERAQRAARERPGPRMVELQLLLALCREPRSAAYRCCERLAVTLPALQVALQERVGTPAPARAALASPSPSASRARKPRVSLSAQQRLAAETERKRSRERRERTTREEPSEPATAPPARTPEAAPALREHASARVIDSRARADRFVLDPARFPTLAGLGRNLCALAAQGRIDPVLGREAEIEQVLDVLARRRANNPILVGPPGVGKTAIVEGVALALARGRERGASGKLLYELPVTSLVAGTSLRGALSERLQALILELARAEGRVIVFIDEIHSLIGGDDGADSLVGALKAALARGELPCIGATTSTEYQRVFERDAALARRFTRIDVDPPSPEIALAILRGIAPEYERHHAVAYEPEALEAAVVLGVRFLAERQLPDKAIGLIDQAAARVKRRGGARVSLAAVAEVVAEQCAVPLERLLMRDAEALIGLETELERRVIGQREPIAAIADALRKGAAGFRGARPLATFLFLGPTGVGKTEMAKAIAERMFPGAAMTRLDMSELAEPHTVARLIGAPPGYIGYEEGGQLTEAVRARPYQLVLLDEIEKAHRDVQLALLPLLDEGRLTDARGKRVDFTNTVVVMTSNLGAEASQPERATVGFGAERAPCANVAQRALELARRALPPELWNRIDEPLHFAALDRAAVRTIAERMSADVAALMLREHGIRVMIAASAIDTLIAAGYDSGLGARPMRRAVGRLLEARLARAVLSGELVRGAAVTVRSDGDRLVLETDPPRADAAE